MATLQGKAVKNTYRQVLQIGANNVGVSGTMQPVQDGAGVNTALSLSTAAATINGTLTITGDLIITGGGIQIQDLIDDTVASLIQNGTGITWAYNDTNRTLTPTITIATADGGVQGDFLQLNVNANEASAVGKLKWNTTDGTMDIGLMGGNVVLQVGQEQVARVLNNSGTNFTEAGYQAVKITSAQGQRLAVGLAQANNEANSKDTLGLVTENISNNQEGFVTTSGLVRQIDTTGDLQTEVWVDGDTLYLSPTVPGRITKVKPLAPNQTVIVGFVVYAHKNQGKIFVKVDNGYEISELHDVRITSVANNNVLKYNSSLAVWENVAPITTWITEGTNLYYTQGRFDSAFAAKSTTNLAEGTNLYFTTARGDANFATNFATKTTTNLPEGTNLYFTDARFDTRFSTKTTTNLAEGSNLYYTQARFNTAFDAKTTTDLDEGTNLYYTDARARLALASSATGLTYANNSGVFSLTAGYAIPTTVKLGQYDIAYNRSIVSAAVSGTTTKTLSLTQQDANVVTATWTDLGITTINGTANQITATTVANTTTLAFTNDVTMPNNLVVSGNLTINGTATYVNTQSISAKDPLFEVANDNNTTDAVDIGYYGRFYDSIQTRVEFTGLFRDASDAGKFKFFTGLVDEPTNVVNTTGTGYTVGTLVANFEGNLAGTANAANALTTARSISATGDAAWTVNFDGSANATAALTLANTGVTATTYGTSTSVPTIAVDAKGRITSASNTNIAFPVTTVNGQAGTVVLTTANVAEGGSNQYFTNARAQAAITLSTTGTSGAATYTSGNINVPIYIGGSGTANQIAYFDTTGTISSLGTATYPSLTELSYVKGVTSAIQTQINSKLNLGGGTLTGPLIGTSATFSSTLGVTGVLTGTNATFSLGSSAVPTASNSAFYPSASLSSTAYAGTYYDGSTAYGSFFGRVPSTISSINDGLGYVTISGGTPTLRVLFSNSELKLNVPLNGTTASFSGNIACRTTNGQVLSTGNGVDTDLGIFVQTNNIAFSNTGTTSGFSFVLGGSTRFSIASTGAATFSSSVTANGAINARAGGYLALYDISTNTNRWDIYTNSDNSYRMNYNGSGGDEFVMTSGGNVGIGTSSPSVQLDVASSARFNSAGNWMQFETNVLTSLNNDGAHIRSVVSADSAPTYSWKGDTNTGMYTPGADNIGFSTAALERLRINATGQVGINTNTFDFGERLGIFSSVSYTLHSKRTGTGSEAHFAFSNGNGGVGSIFTNGTSTSYNTSSDYRLKQDFKDYNGLDLVSAIKTYDYKWKLDETRAFGVIAHELAEVLPYAVVGEKDGEMMQGVDYSKIVPILVKAIQELTAKVEALEAK